jgi:hypothetical protein
MTAILAKADLIITKKPSAKADGNDLNKSLDCGQRTNNSCWQFFTRC